MLVIFGTPYSNQVPIQMATIVIDREMQAITDEELIQANETRKQTHMSTIITNQII